MRTKAIATPPGEPTKRVELTAKEEKERAAEEARHVPSTLQSRVRQRIASDAAFRAIAATMANQRGVTLDEVIDEIASNA